MRVCSVPLESGRKGDEWTYVKKGCQTLFKCHLIQLNMWLAIKAIKMLRATDKHFICLRLNIQWNQKGLKWIEGSQGNCCKYKVRICGEVNHISLCILFFSPVDQIKWGHPYLSITACVLMQRNNPGITHRWGCFGYSSSPVHAGSLSARSWGGLPAAWGR